jgi:hypothetical protein
LVTFFLGIRYRGGRHSVLVGTGPNGSTSQKDAGPLIDFIGIVIQPLNDYLQENGKPKLSPAWVTRFGLEERRDERRLIESRRGKSSKSVVQQENPIL